MLKLNVYPSSKHTRTQAQTSNKMQTYRVNAPTPACWFTTNFVKCDFSKKEFPFYIVYFSLLLTGKRPTTRAKDLYLFPLVEVVTADVSSCCV